MSEYPDGFGPGWEPRPEEVEAVRSELPIQSFGTTEANSATDIPQSLFGWELFQKAFGTPWPVLNQGSVGSCVAHSCVNALCYSQAWESCNGDGEIWRPLSREVVYGGSRVEIGKGRLRGDGSIGAWAAKWVHQYGTVAEDEVGTYSESRCRQFGSHGVPDDIEAKCRDHKIGDVTAVNNFEEAVKALASGFGVAVCSGQGFSMQRDKDGHASPRGHWSHAMAFVGYKHGSRPALALCNSWGSNTTTGPQPDGLPACCWWVDADVCTRMLRQEDSWAYSKYSGFPARKLNWLI